MKSSIHRSFLSKLAPLLMGSLAIFGILVLLSFELKIDHIENLNVAATFNPLPQNYCIDDDASLHSFLGDPIGGVYSGPGVQNIGDGFNFVFRPNEAGAGTHTLTYTVGGMSATTMVTVFAKPNVTFTALADIDINAGVQTGLSGGLPSGGVYSGPGVTDNGNGLTYSFDPAAAGGGTKVLSYSYTDTNGCNSTATDEVEVTTAITVNFTAPNDLCLNAGLQSGLGGATPTGGVYSGPGVTDDGNGMTYSFNPATAGVGTHNLTYTVTQNGSMGSASDQVEVLALPTVSFTSISDRCINTDATLETFKGSPTGGTYSGPGITDLGGSAFSFDPQSAGSGVHTLNYTFTDISTGCSNTASTQVEVFVQPNTMFTALADLPIDAGIQTGQSGGTPVGGVYSGPGVADDGNGMTYSFNPSTAGGGVKILSYSYVDVNGCDSTATDEVVVTTGITVTFTAPDDLCLNVGIQNGLGGATPAGGVYSGPGVTDNGNGMTYSFNPSTAGVGVHTITYNITSGGSMGSGSDNIEVFGIPSVSFTAPGDMCLSDSTDLYLSLGQPEGGIYSGPGVTHVNDLAFLFSPAMAGEGLHTLSYTVTNEEGCSNSATDDILVESCSDTIIWVGTTSNNWDDPANWNINQVPKITSIVVIPSVNTNDPVILANNSGLARRVLIQTDGILTIEALGSLSIESDIDPIEVGEGGELIVDTGATLDANIP